MIPLKSRLKSKADFERTFQKGRHSSWGCVSLVVFEKEGSLTRIGIAVSAKLFPRAVERNRVKRIMRSLLGARIENIQKGRDMVFMVKKSKEKAIEREKLEKDLDILLKKAGLVPN